MSSEIPILREPMDELSGPVTLKDIGHIAHPVELIQTQFEIMEMERRKKVLGQIYGSYVPMQMNLEHAILGQFQRLPGLKSSFAGLEALTGKDEQISYADYLGNPEYNTKYNVDITSAIEKRFGDAPTKRFS